MNFLFPGFLFALLAVAIPIIIHLFHFRRFRRVFFSNVAFLQQLSDESKRQSRLRHLLVLLCRILAVAFAVLAFARPYIPVADAVADPDGNAVAIYIDNSFSMDALSDQGRLLDEAKQKARQIADAYQLTDQYLLLTNDFEARHQRFVSREVFDGLVDEVAVSPVVRTTKEIIERQALLLNESGTGSKRSYLLSDFQQSATTFTGLVADSAMAISLIPLYPLETDNIYIDSCWFESPVKVPGQTASLQVRISNDSNRSLTDQPVRLFIDGVQRTIATVDLPPKGSAEVSLSWTISTPGMHHGRVEIIDYPVTFDDNMYFSYQVIEQIPVLAIHGARQSPFLRALFGRDSLFLYTQMPAFSVDFSVFADYHVLILDGVDNISSGMSLELQAYVEQGGTLVIFPSERIDFVSYREFMMNLTIDPYTRLDSVPVAVSQLNHMHPLYAGVFAYIPEQVDLPSTIRHYVFPRQLRSVGQDLLSLQNGNTFFASYRPSDGEVFVSAVALTDAFSNFQRHALFVPTMANIALQSRTTQDIYQLLGSQLPVTIKGISPLSDQVFLIRGEELEMIPDQRRSGNQWQLFLQDQIQRAGPYDIYYNNDVVQGLSLNYDRRESSLQTFGKQELQAMIADGALHNIQVMDYAGADFERSLREFQMGKQLWRLFLILALLCLLAEALLLRFWR